MRAFSFLRLSIPLLTFFTDIATARSLSFIEPRATALTALGNDIEYTVGENVTVRWSTDFEYTTLRVWQGPLDDGSYAHEFLGRKFSAFINRGRCYVLTTYTGNWTLANTTFAWNASAIDHANLTHAFHFELSNGHDGSCENCTANSVSFYVTRQAISTTSSTSSIASSTSSVITGTHSSTASPTSTTHAIAGNAATASPIATANKSKANLAVPLGVGLGVGIPVLLALCGLLAFCLLRRRKRAQASNLPRGRQPESALSPNQVVMQERGSREPLHPVQPIYVPYRPSSHARSSGGATSGRVSSTHSSYFEPFEFERPGSQDFDTRSVMSEVTTHGANAVERLDAIDEDEPGTPNWPLPVHRL